MCFKYIQNRLTVLTYSLEFILTHSGKNVEMESEERSKLQSLPFLIRHEKFQLCLVFPFWKFSLFISIPTTPPRVLTCSFNAQDCKPIVAWESLLIQQFVLEQWRGKAHFVSTGRVPRIAICIHSSLTKQVRTMPNYFLWPRKHNIYYLWHWSKQLRIKCLK